MTQITVETKFSPDIIEQFVGYPDGLSPVLAQVLRLKDDGVRQALITLGWTPPELSRLRSSLAPVVGGVPVLTDDETDLVVTEFSLKEEWPDDGVSEDFMEYVRWGVIIGMRYMASRLPALKPGEVAQLRAVEKCAEEFLASWAVGPLQRERIASRALRSALDALRAQPTPTEKETDHG